MSKNQNGCPNIEPVCADCQKARANYPAAAIGGSGVGAPGPWVSSFDQKCARHSRSGYPAGVNPGFGGR